MKKVSPVLCSDFLCILHIVKHFKTFQKKYLLYWPNPFLFTIPWKNFNYFYINGIMESIHIFSIQLKTKMATVLALYQILSNISIYFHSYMLSWIINDVTCAIINCILSSDPITCYRCKGDAVNSSCADPIDVDNKVDVKQKECDRGICLKWTKYEGCELVRRFISNVLPTYEA